MKCDQKTKTVKIIKVDVDKCNGCKACEVVCSAFHAIPKYSSINPARSRIRVLVDELNDVYLPVRAGSYTQAECIGRNIYTIGGKEYGECSFCPVACPAREDFKDPDSGLTLKCEVCEEDSDASQPKCVEACVFDALTYEEREEEKEEEEEGKPGELEMGLESLLDKHGAKTLMDTIARLAKW